MTTEPNDDRVFLTDPDDPDGELETVAVAPSPEPDPRPDEPAPTLPHDFAPFGDVPADDDDLATTVEVPAATESVPAAAVAETLPLPAGEPTEAVAPETLAVTPPTAPVEPPPTLADEPREPSAALDATQTLETVAEPTAPTDPTARRSSWGSGTETLVTEISDSAGSGTPSTTPAILIGGRPTVAGGQRFHVLRPHARGGLGEVLVALDIELNREVALKQIQDPHADNPNSRARFLVEAEVTGGLEHPGIVPVYSLGRYGDGRPYYAMRFIRGDSLKRALARFHEADKPDRDPGERSLALRGLLGRFIDVCQAIEYAHSRGILHRDLKPDNVMLGPYGETLVVDWGLAKPLGRSTDDESLPLVPVSSSGSAVTQHGSTIGTPQFMSPEQAAGAIDDLSPASDVYSLGATLYQVLVGQPPVVERHIREVLKKVRTGDFPRPRQVKADIPPALEAICLKAMALRPEDRYDSARALAEDVEHWLADEPVSAWPEPWQVRLGRWAKRHKAEVTGAAALLITALFAVTVGAVLIGREKERTAANFRLACDAVDRMLTQVGQVELADVPQMEKVRADMLGRAREFYETFLKQHSTDAAVRLEAGRARERLGEVQALLGRDADAERSLRAAMPLLEGLIADFPRDPRYRRDLARSYTQLGMLLKRSGRFKEAEEALRSGLQIRRRLFDEGPDDPDAQQDFNDSTYQLGALYRRFVGKRAEVERAYADALARQKKLVRDHPDRPEAREERARYLNNYGMLLGDTDPAEAVHVFKQAIEVQDALLAEAPSVPLRRWRQARTYSNLATLQARAESAAKVRDAPESVANFGRAREHLGWLMASYRSIPDYRAEHAAVDYNLGLRLVAAERIGEALPFLDEALITLRNLTTDYPQVIDYRLRLARAELLLAVVADRDPKSAEAHDRQAIKVYRKLVADYPAVAEYRSDLGSSLNKLARLLTKASRPDEARSLALANAGRLGEARSLAEEAIGIDTKLLEQDEANDRFRESLGEARQNLVEILIDSGLLDAAADAAEQLIKDRPEVAVEYYRAAVDLIHCSRATPASPKDRALERRRKFAGRAVDLLRKGVERGLLLPQDVIASPDLKPLSKWNDDFEALLQELKARINPPVG
ncbi:MAG TPA: protein kinase [Isosphaeraceae bacterium]|jgi:serine/threonine-protein kinase|nr:protein kinase [Isosphaeraceae bacterium]